MSKDKQIEEMAKYCIYHDNGKCNADITEDNECDLMCKMFGTFTNLEMADYRKQSEVSKEIFEDIDKVISEQYPIYTVDSIIKGIAELKKKYTEDTNG